MPTPIAPRIILAQNAQVELQTFARAHTTPQALAFRARMVLRAAAVDQPTNLQISRELGCSNLTVGKWRRRYLELGLPGLQDARRSGRPRAIAAPTRVHVISVASTLPHDHERTVTRWTLDEIVATVLDALHTDSISRSSIWRILHDVDLKPHKSEYWLNSHDADFDAKAHRICQVYATARATPIRIGGRTRESPRSGTRRLVVHDANNAKGEPVLARVLNDLRGYSMHRDLTENTWLNL